MSPPTLTQKIALLATRVLQWSSTIIVVGLNSYFISKRHNVGIGQHIKYIEVISTISLVIFLPAFFAAFVESPLSVFVMAIDIVFSYLWLTAFIFAAQDYNWHHHCRGSFPFGISCSKKYASEAFIFLTFFFTFLGIFLQFWSFWDSHQEKNAQKTALRHEKDERAHSTGAAPPRDGPVENA